MSTPPPTSQSECVASSYAPLSPFYRHSKSGRRIDTNFDPGACNQLQWLEAQEEDRSSSMAPDMRPGSEVASETEPESQCVLYLLSKGQASSDSIEGLSPSLSRDDSFSDLRTKRPNLPLSQHREHKLLIIKKTRSSHRAVVHHHFRRDFKLHCPAIAAMLPSPVFHCIQARSPCQDPISPIFYVQRGEWAHPGGTA